MRVSSDTSKQSCACALRVTNAGRGAVSPWQTGTCTAEAARRSLRSPRRATPMVPATSRRTVGAGSMDPCSSAAIAPSIWLPRSSRARPSAKSSQRPPAEVRERSVDELMSISAVALRLRSTATRPSKSDACEPLSVHVVGWHTPRCRSVEPRSPRSQQLQLKKLIDDARFFWLCLLSERSASVCAA